MFDPHFYLHIRNGFCTVILSFPYLQVSVMFLPLHIWRNVVCVCVCVCVSACVRARTLHAAES